MEGYLTLSWCGLTRLRVHHRLHRRGGHDVPGHGMVQSNGLRRSRPLPGFALRLLFGSLSNRVPDDVVGRDFGVLDA